MVHIPSNLTHILVKFDNAEVGVKAKQSSQFRNYLDAVPLTKYMHEAVFLANVALRSHGCSFH